MTDSPAAAASSRANSAVLLGSATTGLAGMAFIILTERSMSTLEFESIAHLWTIWSIAGAVATFAVQQWIISARRSGYVALRTLLDTRIVTSVVALSAGVLAFTFAFRVDLFASTRVGWPLAAAAIPLGSVVIGVARGLWATDRRFVGLGTIIALENVLRLIAATGLAVVGASSGWFAGALLLGFAAALVVPTRSHAVPAKDVELPSTNLLLATAVAGFFSHTAINGGPTILAIAGAPDAPVAELFLVLTIARLPLLLAVHGLLPIFSVRVNAMIVARDLAGIAATRRRFAIAGPLLATAAGTIGAFVGPWITATIFETSRQLGRLDYGLAIGLVILAGASLVANTALVAEGRIRYQMLAWGVPALLGLGFLAVSGTPTARTVLCTVLVAELFILALVTHVASAVPQVGRNPVETRTTL